MILGRQSCGTIARLHPHPHPYSQHFDRIPCNTSECKEAKLVKELMVFPETHGQNLNPVLSNRVSALTTERLLYQEEKNCTLPKSPEIAWQVLKGKCHDGRQIWFVIWSHTTKPLMNLKHWNWAQIKAYCLDSCCTVSCPNVLVRKTNDTASPAFFTASSFKRTRHVRILNDKGCNSAAKTSILKAVKTSKHFTALVLEPKSTFWYDSKPYQVHTSPSNIQHII